MAGRVAAEQCLQKAYVVIRDLVASGADVTTRPGLDAWGDLKIGVSKAGADIGPILDDVADDTIPILVFIADFAAAKKIYRSQADSILDKLFSIPQVVEAARRQEGLRSKLGEAVNPDRVHQWLGGGADAVQETAEPAAAQAEARSLAPEQPSLAPPPQPQAQVATPAFSPAPRVEETVPKPLPASGGQSSASSSPQATPRSPWQDLDSAAASAAADAAACDETRRMLRTSFEAIVALRFDHSDENAITAFSHFYTATSRAHWEHQRLTRPVLPSADSETFSSSTEGGEQRSIFAGKFGDLDHVTDWLTCGPQEMRQLLMFLLKLAKHKHLHRKRIECTAQMLTQVSSTCRSVARSDEFLMRWLGAKREADELAEFVSYGFASALKWAAWDATWHCVYRRRGRHSKSEFHKKEWDNRIRAFQELSELPQNVLDILTLAAWEAAEHTSLIRWPEESRSVLSVIAGAFWREEDKSPHKDKFHRLFDEIQQTGTLAESLQFDLRWMVWNTAWTAANRSKRFRGESREALLRAERHLQRAFRGESQWRGVNLGGWFLLEPGPCTDFWQNLPPEAQAAQCEWGCCEALGRDVANRLLRQHRRTYFSHKDFEEIKAAGLTHVRLPIGAWCIVGPRQGEPYVGPCLEELDLALDLIEEEGLNVVLDLHGAVGGESDEPPCGHQNRSWHHGKWDTQASLLALKVIAERYCGRACVCGVGVCNEPHASIPAQKLAQYYEDAIRTIRHAGMRAGEVAVLLPIFTESRITEILDMWESRYREYDDVVFDLHLYQCFGTLWGMSGLEGHMTAAAGRKDTLSKLPSCCVSEWSVALPTSLMESFQPGEDRDIYERFATTQLEAYESATHGWFFWTWKDNAGLAWNMRDCLKKGILPVRSGGRSTNLINP